MAIEVILADDHNLLRQALSVLLEREPDIHLAGDAADGQAALRLAQEIRPDIAVMDISMPGLNGIETTRRLIAKIPGIKVIALSAHSDRKFIYHMFQAGASGYLLKDCVCQELVFAIRSVARNQTYISPQIANGVLEEYLSKAQINKNTVFLALTGREREVLQLLAEGKSTKQTALLLNVSSKTIETHRRQIMEKLRIHNIAELTKYAIREGLTSL